MAVIAHIVPEIYACVVCAEKCRIVFAFKQDLALVCFGIVCIQRSASEIIQIQLTLIVRGRRTALVQKRLCAAIQFRMKGSHDVVLIAAIKINAAFRYKERIAITIHELFCFTSIRAHTPERKPIPEV